MDGTQKEVVTGIDGYAYDFFSGKRNLGNQPAFANAEKAASLLEWETTKDLNTMIEDTWRWQSQNPNGFE